MNLPLQYGSQGSDVVELQKMLNLVGNKLIIDGLFGKGTGNAVKYFQNASGLYVDGIVGLNTWSALVAASAPNIKPDNDAVDEFILLNDNEYVKSKSTKKGICLHHTVSDGNGAKVVGNWENDTRGAVATHFVVGREMVNGGNAYDGKVIQCFDLDYWAHHILTTRMGFNGSHNNLVNAAYVGIELCAWGCLQKKGDQFWDLSGNVQIPEYQVTKLARPFRTYQYWHKYTDDQLHALGKLIKHIGNVCHIDFTDLSLEPETVNSGWWEMDWNAMVAGYGSNQVRKLTTHTNFEYGKFDTFPQPELIELIKSIYHASK